MTAHVHSLVSLAYVPGSDGQIIRIRHKDGNEIEVPRETARAVAHALIGMTDPTGEPEPSQRPLPLVPFTKGG